MVGKDVFVKKDCHHVMAIRLLVGGICIFGLVAVFLFQRWDIAGIVGIDTNINRFLFNRTIRFLLNDAFTIGLIYALFVERKYVIFSLYVQVVGVIIFLLPYFVLKIYFPTYNGPLISFLHRLILNPILLMLLIPAFYYQKAQSSPQRHEDTKKHEES